MRQRGRLGNEKAELGDEELDEIRVETFIKALVLPDGGELVTTEKTTSAQIVGVDARDRVGDFSHPSRIDDDPLAQDPVVVKVEDLTP